MIIAKRTSGGQTYRTFEGEDRLPLSPSYSWKVVNTRNGNDVIIIARNRKDAIRLGKYHLSFCGKFDRCFR